jgi:hypothetical protein
MWFRYEHVSLLRSPADVSYAPLQAWLYSEAFDRQSASREATICMDEASGVGVDFKLWS